MCILINFINYKINNYVSLFTGLEICKTRIDDFYKYI
jgi:hypothetical protein